MSAADVAAHEAASHVRRRIEPMPATATADELRKRAESLAAKSEARAAKPDHRLRHRVDEYRQAAARAAQPERGW